MLAFRVNSRSPAARILLQRPNSTLAQSGSSNPSDTPMTQGRRRIKRTFVKPTRPAISVDSPRKWNPPLPEGALPAYDLALKVIRADSRKLREEAKEVKEKIEVAERDRYGMKNGDADAKLKQDELLEALREKLHVLEVQSEVNLPEVRWTVSNAMVDMTKPAHRHLVEHRWRKDGDLDLLMERVHQMKVVPDVLPRLHPSLDLRVATKSSPEVFRTNKRVDSEVEPGVFLTSHQTLDPPKLYTNVFHTDTRLYTLLMVDPDVPDEEGETFSTYLHWMSPNVPLSAAVRSRIPNLNSHTKYVPPHPQRGSPYHRYVLLLLPQPPLPGSRYGWNTAARAQAGIPTSQHLDIPIVDDAARNHFDVRAFARQWGLNGALGGGVHMWREVWDEQVSKIYANILKIDEPRYGRPQKADPYEQVKQTKRYI